MGKADNMVDGRPVNELVQAAASGTHLGRDRRQVDHPRDTAVTTGSPTPTCTTSVRPSGCAVSSTLSPPTRAAGLAWLAGCHLQEGVPASSASLHRPRAPRPACPFSCKSAAQAIATLLGPFADDARVSTRSSALSSCWVAGSSCGWARPYLPYADVLRKVRSRSDVGLLSPVSRPPAA